MRPAASGFILWYNTRMRPIATDKSDFEELRKAGQIYVDKTAYFHRLITEPSRSYFFCARPRRFGKSLGVPDEEVRRDLAMLMTGVAANQDMKWAANLGVQLRLCEWDSFFDGLKALYAGMAYGPSEGRKHESSYARCLAFLLASQGFRFRMEDVQADGRADIVAEHPCSIYIFELKVDEPAAAALEQVKAKGYDAPYRAKGLPIHAIGLSFDSKTRHLADGAAVEL